MPKLKTQQNTDSTLPKVNTQICWSDDVKETIVAMASKKSMTTTKFIVQLIQNASLETDGVTRVYVGKTRMSDSGSKRRGIQLEQPVHEKFLKLGGSAWLRKLALNNKKAKTEGLAHAE